MNSTGLDCLVLSYQHRRPSLYESHSFFYVSKLVLALSCVSSPVSSVGNGLVLLAIIRTSYLHTPDNILVGALAVADCAIGVVVQPMTMTIMIKTSVSFGSCPFVTAYTLAGFVCSSSVSLMAAISGERCIALFYPLRYNSLVTNNRAFTVALLIWFAWVVAACCSCFGGVVFTIGQVFAGIVWFSSCVIVGGSYIKICLLVRHHRRQIHAQHHAAASNVTANTASQAKLAITMGYIIGLSLLCYLPTTLVCQIFYTSKQPDNVLFDAFYVLIGVQLMSSSLNPVIYCWRRRDIRKAVVNQLRAFCQCCGMPLKDKVQPLGHSRHNINASMRVKDQISTTDPFAA